MKIVRLTRAPWICDRRGCRSKAVVSIQCDHQGCLTEPFLRCTKHGGEAGALRSYRAHAAALGHTLPTTHTIQPLSPAPISIPASQIVRVRLDFKLFITNDTLPCPNIMDLLEPGVLATIPNATAILPNARICVTKTKR